MSSALNRLCQIPLWMVRWGDAHGAISRPVLEPMLQTLLLTPQCPSYCSFKVIQEMDLISKESLIDLRVLIQKSSYLLEMSSGKVTWSNFHQWEAIRCLQAASRKCTGAGRGSLQPSAPYSFPAAKQVPSYRVRPTPKPGEWRERSRVLGGVESPHQPSWKCFLSLDGLSQEHSFTCLSMIMGEDLVNDVWKRPKLNNWSCAFVGHQPLGDS